MKFEIEEDAHTGRGCDYGPRNQTRSRSDLNAAVRKANELKGARIHASKLAASGLLSIQNFA